MKHPDLEHPELGILQYQQEYDWYEGKIEVQQSEILIRLSTDERGNVAAALERANNLVEELERYAQLAKEYAAVMLLQIKNETWIDDDEQPLTPEQFQQRTSLESISIDAAGEISFYHNDDDLFWGHCILVTMDSENNFIGAEIAG
ncbi:DUF2262 domain-containing protein [Chamaesiphon sp. VAR_69_metabat_338]|uniref:DUF2262 domain-containing protein n=1 Tax=Chamaesiphon sp. VAR_69_metabat_338 TaxID=2964704 RepID=UPI00286E6F81|nr:DUF2262 domain-containing protein [Chamaesiphon sp. VAR_69_metabat_338]